jgi:hypothetical protein
MGKVFNSREIIKLLKDDGWHLVKDLYGRVLDSIFKQAGWK